MKLLFDQVRLNILPKIHEDLPVSGDVIYKVTNMGVLTQESWSCVPYVGHRTTIIYDVMVEARQPGESLYLMSLQKLVFGKSSYD